VAQPRTTRGRRIRGLDADQRREQRRGQLLDAALELFAANGYLNTSIEQLCQAAYVGTKAFYEVFDSRESCYIALLQRITERISTRLTETLRDAPADEPAATRMLINALAHALVDDPRIARVTFGQSAAISPAVERQRRTNRRWAASFIESIWRRYGVTAGRGKRRVDLHRVAIGVIGGMFDLIADWLLDAEPDRPDDVASLIRGLTDFYQTVRDGLAVRPG
jgi:AcrR family transcriptional regulator